MAKFVGFQYKNFKEELNAIAKTGVHKQVGDILSIQGVEFDASEKGGKLGMAKLKPYQNYAEQRQKQELEAELKEKLGYVPKLKPNEKLTPKLVQELVLEKKLKLEEIAQRNKLKGPENR